MSYAWGIVQEVDAAKARAKVFFPEDEVLSAWLPVLQVLTFGAKLFVLPRVGALVAVLQDEHGDEGVILGGVYNGKDAPPAAGPLALVLELEDGTRITAGTGGIDVVSTGHVSVSAPLVSLTGAVAVSGSLGSDTGASGTFTTPTGCVVTVQNGLITNIF